MSKDKKAILFGAALAAAGACGENEDLNVESPAEVSLTVCPEPDSQQPYLLAEAKAEALHVAFNSAQIAGRVVEAGQARSDAEETGSLVAANALSIVQHASQRGQDLEDSEELEFGQEVASEYPDLAKAIQVYGEVLTSEPLANGNLSVTFIDPINNFQSRTEILTPDNQGNQDWFDQVREAMGYSAEDVEAQYPFTAIAREESSFSAMRTGASTEYNGRPMIEVVRENFAKGLEGTDLAEFLGNDLEYFIDFVTTAIPSLESSWNNDAESASGAAGIMQITDGRNRNHDALGNVYAETDIESYIPRSEFDITNPEHSAFAAARLFEVNFWYLKQETQDSNRIFNEELRRDLFIPLAVQGYHSGKGRAVQIANYMNGFDYTEANGHPYLFYLANSYQAAVNGTRVDGEIAIGRGFGRDSYQYALKAFTIYSLFQSEEIDQSQGEERIVQRQVEQIPEHIVEDTPEINFIDSAEDPTRNIDLSISDEVKTFLSSANHSQDQVQISGLLGGLGLHEALPGPFNAGEIQENIERMLGAGQLLDFSNASSIYVDIDETSVAETYRRVLTPVQFELVKDVSARMNELLYANGLSTEYFVTPTITSAIRTNNGNANIGGSVSSYHRRFSALDFRVTGYTINKINENGSVTRWRIRNHDKNSSVVNAARQALYEIVNTSHDGRYVFGREEVTNPHLHIVVVPENGSHHQIVEHNGENAYSYVVPNMSLGSFIQQVTGRDAVSEVRVFNDMPPEPDFSDESTLFRPGDTILIPSRLVD